MDDFKTKISQLRQKIVEFRDERNWKKYHRPKDLAISIAVEAAELMEAFQWRQEEEIEQMLKDSKVAKEIAWELADILIYALSFSEVCKIDISRSIEEKLEHNQKKFPKEKMQKIFSSQDWQKTLDEMKEIKRKYRGKK